MLCVWWIKFIDEGKLNVHLLNMNYRFLFNVINFSLTASFVIGVL